MIFTCSNMDKRGAKVIEYGLLLEKNYYKDSRRFIFLVKYDMIYVVLHYNYVTNFLYKGKKGKKKLFAGGLVYNAFAYNNLCSSCGSNRSCCWCTYIFK